MKIEWVISTSSLGSVQAPEMTTRFLEGVRKGLKAKFPDAEIDVQLTQKSTGWCKITDCDWSETNLDERLNDIAQQVMEDISYQE